MTRLRFFLGLIGVPMAAQKQETKGASAPSVLTEGESTVVDRNVFAGCPRKPENGECPVCSTEATLDDYDRPINAYKASEWTNANLLLFQRKYRVFESRVMCRFCKVVFVVERQEEK